MNILLTGGAGYIGSHTAVAVAQAGHTPFLLDNFANSQPSAIQATEAVIGNRLSFFQADVQDTAFLAQVLADNHIDAVIHFAALKAVAESVTQPLRYFQNNVGGLLSLLKAMQQAGCKTLVFSSSATVYGDPAHLPLTETSPVRAVNPYGSTKLMSEQILQDLQASDPTWRFSILRYFNPVGAHPSGLIGESPRDEPANLCPYLVQVAAGLRPYLRVYGNDYPTPDGTGVRDYIHVMDLAEAHVKAVEAMRRDGHGHLVNLGVGRGYSVLEFVRAFEKVNKVEIPLKIEARRPGDVAACYSDSSLALQMLHWKAQRSLDDMVGSAWKAAQTINASF